MLTLETCFHVIIHHQANLVTHTNEKSVKLHKHKYHMCQFWNEISSSYNSVYSTHSCFGMRSPVLTIVFTVHIHVLE